VLQNPNPHLPVQEHLRKRLEAEQAEKEQRQKDKAEAHQYVTLKVGDVM
jgi:hypothetical protein